jgi:hypothetical protein
MRRKSDEGEREVEREEQEGEREILLLKLISLS